MQTKLYELEFFGSQTKDIPMHFTLGSYSIEQEEELNNINMHHKNELDSLRNRTDLFMNNNSMVNNQIELNLKLKKVLLITTNNKT